MMRMSGQDARGPEDMTRSLQRFTFSNSRYQDLYAAT